MTILAGRFGVRLQCDICGECATSPDLSVVQLRRAVGFAHAGGRDTCDRCAPAPLVAQEAIAGAEKA
jgi:recombinational DNA repair protein (RecF pathway)